MSEKQRLCLGCRRYFRSSSASNRFCKICKKKRRKLRGSFQPLDTGSMPQALSMALSRRYYDDPSTIKASRIIRTSPPKEPALPVDHTPLKDNTPWEWGPLFPAGI